jgi:hypothetical protein
MDSTIALHQFRNLVSHVFRLTMSLRGADGDPAKHFDDFLNTTLTILADKEQAVRVHNALERHADAVFSDMMLARDAREMFEPPPVSPRCCPPRGNESGPTLIIHHDSKPAPVQAAEVIVTKADEDAGPKIVSLGGLASNSAPTPTPVQVEPNTEEEEVDDEDEELGEEVEEEADDDAEGEVVEEVEDEADDDAEGEVVEEVEEEADDGGEVVEEVEEEADNDGEVVEEAEADDDEEGEVEAEEEEEEAEVEAEEEEEGVELVKIGRKKYFVGEHSKLVYEAVDDDTPGDAPLGRYENGKITKL